MDEEVALPSIVEPRLFLSPDNSVAVAPVVVGKARSRYLSGLSIGDIFGIWEGLENFSGLKFGTCSFCVG